LKGHRHHSGAMAEASAAKSGRGLDDLAQASISQMQLLSAPAFAIHVFGLSMSVYVPTYLSQATTLNIALIGFAFMSVRVVDMCSTRSSLC